MYSGFNLKVTADDFSPVYKDMGERLFLEHKQIIQETLTDFISPDGKLLASKMQEAWFPEIKADIFISHSHADKETALRLAGWLKNDLNLTAFIDSGAWGNVEELLKIIDNKYCMNDSGTTYIYEKRNRSTSHVHMILSIALARMIDETESIFFLNTPSSVTSESVVNDSADNTSSPWIFSEIAMTQLLRKRTKDYHRNRITKSLSERALAKAEEFPTILHPMSLTHLTPLHTGDLSYWHHGRNKGTHSLDVLYNLKKITD